MGTRAKINKYWSLNTRLFVAKRKIENVKTKEERRNKADDTTQPASEQHPVKELVGYLSVLIDNLYARRRVAHGEIALGTRRGTIRRRRR